MELKVITLDLSNIKDFDSLHNKLSLLFGFPDFCGKNVNALIDCMSGVRFPEEGMAKVNICRDECFMLQIKGLCDAPNEIKNTIIFVIECVNERYLIDKMNPAFLLHLIL